MSVNRLTPSAARHLRVTANETVVLKSLETSSRGHAFPGLHYRNHFDFVLQHGQFFQPPPQLRPRWFRWMRAQCCFRNAQSLALRRGLRYVEGFAAGSGMLVHHGWCVDGRDRVIDPTWRVAGLSYFGVPFDGPSQAMVAGSEETGNLLDDWQRGWPLLRDRFDARWFTRVADTIREHRRCGGDAE